MGGGGGHTEHVDTAISTPGGGTRYILGWGGAARPLIP